MLPLKHVGENPALPLLASEIANNLCALWCVGESLQVHLQHRLHGCLLRVSVCVSPSLLIRVPVIPDEAPP